jgi:hypothetical protein
MSFAEILVEAPESGVRLTGRNTSLGDTQFLEDFSDITPLFKVDVLNILPAQIVLSIRKRLDFIEHDIVHVQSIIS